MPRWLPRFPGGPSPQPRPQTDKRWFGTTRRANGNRKRFTARATFGEERGLGRLPTALTTRFLTTDLPTSRLRIPPELRLGPTAPNGILWLSKARQDRPVQLARKGLREAPGHKVPPAQREAQGHKVPPAQRDRPVKATCGEERGPGRLPIARTTRFLTTDLPTSRLRARPESPQEPTVPNGVW